MTEIALSRRIVAEGLGTAALVATVVGSGAMGVQLADGNMAVALLANTLATGAMLVVLIVALGSISGAHLNPAVSLVFAVRGELPRLVLAAYVLAQLFGGVCGTLLAHAMFELPVVSFYASARTGPAQWLSEVVATFGLVATILAVRRSRPNAVAYCVGLYIAAAYWFTASTSFANPAVAVGRSLTATFSGIRVVDLPGFVAAEIAGALVAAFALGWLLSERSRRAPTAGAESAIRSARDNRDLSHGGSR